MDGERFRKDDFVAVLMNDHDLTKKKAKEIVDSFMDCFYDSLLEGKEIRIPNVCVLRVKSTPPTQYRDPRSRKLVDKPAGYKLKTSVSDVIKRKLSEKAVSS